MGGRAVYTRPNRTTTREVIHVSTPGNDAVPDPGAPTDGDRRDPGDTPARTAVQLDPDLAMAVLGAADPGGAGVDDGEVGEDVRRPGDGDRVGR